MKIKILKDIPGFKEGEIVTGYFKGGDNDDKYIMTAYYRYDRNELIESGIAEEVTDIDIEEIRRRFSTNVCGQIVSGSAPTREELEWFSAYRVVSEVIRQLNGDWVADWNDGRQFKTEIYYDLNKKEFIPISSWICTVHSMLPLIGDKETAQKVIDLCTPELETLFNIK